MHPTPPEPFQLHYFLYTSSTPSFLSTADFNIFTGFIRPSQATNRTGLYWWHCPSESPPIPSCRVSQPALLHPLTHQLIQHGLLLHKQAVKTQANYVLAFLYLSLFVLNQSDISGMISLLWIQADSPQLNNRYEEYLERDLDSILLCASMSLKSSWKR